MRRLLLCAVLVSSQNQSRGWLYYMQQTVSAEGFSGQAFSTFVPHTVRTTETKRCTDCHVSASGDNNAWMANLLLQGDDIQIASTISGSVLSCAGARCMTRRR